MLENFVVKHKVKYLDIAGDWQYVCVCVESGGEFDFGILINIAFIVQINVAGSRRVHMMVPHEAEQGHSNYARLIINAKHTTHTDPKCLSSNYKRHLVACGCN